MLKKIKADIETIKNAENLKKTDLNLSCQGNEYIIDNIIMPKMIVLALENVEYAKVMTSQNHFRVLQKMHNTVFVIIMSQINEVHHNMNCEIENCTFLKIAHHLNSEELDINMMEKLVWLYENVWHVSTHSSEEFRQVVMDNLTDLFKTTTGNKELAKIADIYLNNPKLMHEVCLKVIKKHIKK